MGGIAYQQLSTIVPFILLFFMGFLCGKGKILDGKAIKTLSMVIMNVFSSFVVWDLLQIPKKSQTSSELVWAIVSAIIIYLFFILFSFILFRNRKKETSVIYFCSLCSSSIIILAYPLLNNISESKAPVYTAAFYIVNKIIFGIICTKIIKKRKIIRAIINLSNVIALLGLIFYFCDLQLILPIENTVSKIAETVPTISSLLVGMFLSAFPLKGFKLQFDAIILTVFRLFLLPLIVSALCMIIKISLENTLILVVLSGLPCGFDLPCEISQIQEKNLPCASTLSALSFVASLISIPLICYVTSQIYLFIF